TLAAYEQAAASGQEQGLLDAVEELHARFEALVRVVRPKMKELEAYHVVLYQIYHKLAPNKEIDKLREASGELVAACATLAAAPIPKRFASKSELLAGAFAGLCQASRDLQTASAGGDLGVIEKAVLDVHTLYQLTEQVFESSPQPTH
ncbi:MAG: hypothetical protein V1750_01370, partial [Acidobacteriota bacterium]